MKNAFKIFTITLLSILLCGCSNLLAVHKLNNSARDFMNDNDYQNAISRLEASYELDYRNYQTRYLLSCAYLREKNCNSALEHALFIADLKPKEPSVYLIKGDSYNCVADNVYNMFLFDKENNKLILNNQQHIKRYIYNLTKANESYNKYYDLVPNSAESKDILGKIEENKNEISKMDGYVQK